MIDSLTYRWHLLWAQLARFRQRRNVEAAATAEAELVNLAALLRARYRNWKRRRRR
jgi:hypothetical protein